MLDEETLAQGWAALAVSTHADLLTWRRAHPKATFAELEALAQSVTAQQYAR